MGKENKISKETAMNFVTIAKEAREKTGSKLISVKIK